MSRSLGGEPGASLASLGVYELPPGQGAGAYHYELTREEWLVVVSGELTLRTPVGLRVLTAGDVVAFLPGPAGAHALRNDGETKARYAMCCDVNLLSLALQTDDDGVDGYETSYARVRPLVGGENLGLSVYELPPGQSICPYHYETGEEEWLIVLAGHPTVRTPAGERVLRPWDALFFPRGEAGAHKVTNRTDERARVALWSNRGDPSVSVYPDSDKVGAWPPGKLFRLGDAVDYWDGEI